MSPLGTSTTPPSSTRTGSAYAGFSTTRTGQAMLPAACEGTPEAHGRVAPDAIPAWHHTGLRAGRAFARADPSSQQPRTPTPRCGVSQLGADGDHIDAQLQGFHGRAEARGPTPDDSKGGAFDVGSSGPGGGAVAVQVAGAVLLEAEGAVVQEVEVVVSLAVAVAVAEALEVEVAVAVALRGVGGRGGHVQFGLPRPLCALCLSYAHQFALCCRSLLCCDCACRCRVPDVRFQPVLNIYGDVSICQPISFPGPPHIFVAALGLEFGFRITSYMSYIYFDKSRWFQASPIS
jgi:hypothetical protein